MTVVLPPPELAVVLPPEPVVVPPPEVVPLPPAGTVELVLLNALLSAWPPQPASKARGKRKARAGRNLLIGSLSRSGEVNDACPANYREWVENPKVSKKVVVSASRGFC